MRQPHRGHVRSRHPPLITVTTMAKVVIGQAVFPPSVTLILNVAGASILGHETEEEIAELGTLIFNTLV